jgi:hypothetical protein
MYREKETEKDRGNTTERIKDIRVTKLGNEGLKKSIVPRISIRNLSIKLDSFDYEFTRIIIRNQLFPNKWKKN